MPALQYQSHNQQTTRGASIMKKIGEFIGIPICEYEYESNNGNECKSLIMVEKADGVRLMSWLKLMAENMVVSFEGCKDEK
jgi:hypothetical protein